MAENANGEETRPLPSHGAPGEALSFLTRRLMEQAEALYEPWPLVA